jgi:hypothetical protein
MIGLFHSDCWVAGLAASPIGPQLGKGEMGKSGNTPQHYRGELRVDLAGFLDSAQAKLSRDPPPTSQLCNCSTLQQNQDKLPQMFMCHI